MWKAKLNPSPIEEAGGNYFRGTNKGNFQGSLHRGGLWKFLLIIRRFCVERMFSNRSIIKKGVWNKPVLSKTNLEDLHTEKASVNHFII